MYASKSVPKISIQKKSSTSVSIKSSSKNFVQKRFNSNLTNTAVPNSTSSVFKSLDSFQRRHLSVDEDANVKEMLKTVGAKSVNDLITKTVPSNILFKSNENFDNNIVGGNIGEKELLQNLKNLAMKNKHQIVSNLGLGYYNNITPHVIQRNVLENPGWYTPYTPYQAEISQGRLESLLNYQTMVKDLTGMDISNASLLDEATAAAEAMAMAFSYSKHERNTFLVADDCHPQTIDVVKTRAKPLGVNIVVGKPDSFNFKTSNACGVLIQYPNTFGVLSDLSTFVKNAHESNTIVACATDLLALAISKPPGEFGADITFGNSQRFGVPLGYGGPHAAFFACKDELKRIMPGRIIGVSKDAQGKQAYRMSLQTREQHIRREKATSNICTAQALLANMAAMYSVYHGPEGIKNIANQVHQKALVLAEGSKRLGHSVLGKTFFDTVHIKLAANGSASNAVKAALQNGFNIRQVDSDSVTISLDETTTSAHVDSLLNALSSSNLGASGKKQSAESIAQEISKSNFSGSIPSTPLSRQSKYLTHPVFNSYHTEHEMLRYIHRLEKKDISLTTSMIPLGSCTMKLNATAEMIPVTWPEFGTLHPFVPIDQAQGYQQMFRELEHDLAIITGFDAVTLQPNAGSQGEYTGLLVIKNYHESNGQGQRNVCLIPTSAHGTNPATASMVGMKVVAVACDSQGNVDVSDLKAKAELHKNNLAALMITYPSTHGVFEESITEICDVIHKNGGQVYMDGANMNAQVGLTSPGSIGADVCHLNLHKTFAIPHGGGGPGMGPIGVRKHLAKFLPNHPVVSTGSNIGTAVSAAPYGSGSILPISYVYIKLMGPQGLRRASEMAILNANYMAYKLKDHYPLLFKGKNGYVAHEFIIDMRQFKKFDIEAEDVAKRLMDYGFHAPTMSFPIPNTLMIEPTESESKAELDRLIEALIQIRGEIRDVEEGKSHATNNVLKNAPHTSEVVISDKWDRPYSRELAAFPVSRLRTSKVWPTVSRINNVYGDKNLICSCPSVEELASN